MSIPKQSFGFCIRTHSRRRHDYAWLWHRAGGLVAQVARPVAESQRLSDAGRRRGHHFCEGNSESHHRRLMNTVGLNQSQKTAGEAAFMPTLPPFIFWRDVLCLTIGLSRIWRMP